MPGINTQQDIQITDDGDLLVDGTGDLALSSIDQTTRQDAIFYLYTEFGDFTGNPDIGSRVVDFQGEPNTRTNAQLLRGEMLRALTSAGRFFASDIQLNIIPFDIDTILAYITIQNSALSGTQNIVFNFSYINGLSIIPQ
jgi:hypothetical protein